MTRIESAVVSTAAEPNLSVVSTVVGKRRYVIAFGLLLIYSLGYTDRVNLSVAASHIISEFGLTRGQFGLLTSVFSWSYLIVLVPSGIVLDKTGPKILLPLSILVWSIGSGMTGLATSFGLLIAARFILGIGEGPLLPNTDYVSREWSPSTERGVFTGIAIGGSVIGPAVGSILAAYLIHLFGWQASFYVFGGVGIVVAIFCYIIYQPVEKAKFISEAERHYILDNRGEVVTVGSVAGTKSSGVGKLLKSKTMWGLILTNGCSVYVNYLFLSFLPLYLREARGLAELGSGWVTGVTYGAGSIGSILLVALSDWWLRRTKAEDRHDARRRSLMLTQFLCLPLLFLPLASNTVVIVAVVSWVLAFVIASATLNVTLAGELMKEKNSMGRMFSLVTVGGNVFGLVSPIVTGYLIDWTHSYTVPFIVAGMLAPLGMLATFFLSRDEIRPRIDDRVTVTAV